MFGKRMTMYISSRAGESLVSGNRMTMYIWSPAKETAEENDDLHLKSGRGDFGGRQENDKLLEIDVEKSQ